MTTDAITTAQAPDTFDVLSFIEGTAYPRAEVSVYTDAKSATDLITLGNRRKDREIAEGPITDLDDEIAELAEKVEASKLTFKLQGLPPGMVRDIYNVEEGADDTTQLSAENRLIANTITGAVNSKGQVDSRVWDEEAVGKLRRFLKEAEFGKLITGVIEVNFNAAVFDQASDAGFLG